MEQHNSKSGELSFETLDAVSGGRNKSPYEVVAAAMLDGFEKAGGKLLCFPTGTGGQVCGFSAH